MIGGCPTGEYCVIGNYFLLSVFALSAFLFFLSAIGVTSNPFRGRSSENDIKSIYFFEPLNIRWHSNT